jgi:hypothetical protein
MFVTKNNNGEETAQTSSFEMRSEFVYYIATLLH